MPNAIVSVSVDTLGIAGAVAASINAGGDRSAFVKNLVEETAHKTGRRYNVLVFNLEQGYSKSFRGIKFYASAEFDGGMFVGKTRFGIWVFEEGTFVNDGHGGFINWCFDGNFHRSGDGGKHVKFYRR